MNDDGILRQLEFDFARLIPESTAAQTRDGVKRHHQISDVGVACCLESRSIKEFEKD